jgi:hypothetical protein
MTVPNAFTNFLALQEVIQDQHLYETRIENSMSGQPLYIGINLTPNALTSDPTWYIVKPQYDINGFLTRVQLPNQGIGFTCSWDLRTTYFA